MLEKVIDNNEQIMWQGKPGRFLYTLGNPVFYIFALFWALVDLFIIGMIWTINRGGSAFSGMGGFLIPFFILHLIPVWIAIFSPIYRFFAWRKIEYAITSRRVYIMSGIIGRDFQSLEHYEIQQLFVNVGLLEKMQNRGTIRLTPDVTTRSRGSNSRTTSGHRLKNIENPYDVYNLLKRLSLDVSTDVQYPNAYRPAENPGYGTRYTGGQSGQVPLSDKSREYENRQ